MNRNPNDARTATPREAAEGDEQEVARLAAAERSAREDARREDDDPREEDGWTQPESSAQKGAIRDEG